ncbi:MAG: hypothetical protein KA586_05335 [Candidatus Promineofilum sp.]|nr:hypothetical protein [Promineifilum sp.]
MPEPEEVDPPQSGEPPPANEDNPVALPDFANEPVEAEPGDLESDPSLTVAQPLQLGPGDTEATQQPTVAQPAEVAFAPDVTDEYQTMEPPAGVQDDPLGGESQPGPVEPQDESKPAFPEPRRLSRGERETVDRQRQRFAACGRCGYFIADCQNQLGVEVVQTALLDTADGWLRLTVDHSFHRRVMDAYGVQLDAEFDSIDGTCPECRRRFVVENTDDGLTHLKLRI